MISVLISWIYILVVCLTAGCALFALLERMLPLSKEHSLAGMTTAGVAVLTVYAEYYSLIDGIGAVCHLLMLAGLAACLILVPRVRELLWENLSLLRRLLCSPTGLFLLLLVAGIAFYSSRGNFHTDTGIYHAAAIRWNEEYGVVKGLANLDLHYGYNSAYLVFCSLFTFSWLPGVGALAAGEGTLALHTTTGFLATLYLCYACRRLRYLLQHRSHLGDAARFALLIYIFTNATGLMSPATDYGTLLVCGYLACAWLDVYENDTARRCRSADAFRSRKAFAESTVGAPVDASDNRTASAESAAGVLPEIYEYGLLSMLALFTVSMKLSSAGMFLLVLYPLVILIRQHKWQSIWFYVRMGIVLFLPFLIRNVILSGWLFYPFESIDLFPVAWKVPYEYSKVDSDQIKVWGRCLYDISKVDLPITEWIGTWWAGQSDYGQMLLYGVALSPVLFCVDLVLAWVRGIRVRWDLVLYIAMLYVSVALWFLTAPFIRYGLTFLLVAPLLGAALFADLCLAQGTTRGGLCKVAGVFLTGAILVCQCAWIDHYANADLSFVKQHVRDGYYLAQQPFDTRDEETITLENADGSAQLVVYTAGNDEVNSYDQFPGTCYSFMAERTMLLGDSIEDGLAAK